MECAPQYHTNKMLLIVRNPVKSRVASTILCSKCSYSVQMPFDLLVTYFNNWKWWVADCMGHMRNYYRD